MTCRCRAERVADCTCGEQRVAFREWLDRRPPRPLAAPDSHEDGVPVGFMAHHHELPPMGSPDYFDAVARAAAWEREAAPWMLIRLPGESCVYVATERTDETARETARVNDERRELRERHLAAIAAPKLTF